MPEQKRIAAMTWAEAIRRGRYRWCVWIGICSFLGCCFLIKGGTPSDLRWAAIVGAAVGAAVGFGLGPAADKGATILSSVLVGIPFYLIGVAGFVDELVTARDWWSIQRGGLIVVGVFMVIGCLFSVAQGYQMSRAASRKRDAVGRAEGDGQKS
jgi:hypothetical protein